MRQELPPSTVRLHPVTGTRVKVWSLAKAARMLGVPTFKLQVLAAEGIIPEPLYGYYNRCKHPLYSGRQISLLDTMLRAQRTALASPDPYNQQRAKQAETKVRKFWDGFNERNRIGHRRAFKRRD